MHGYLLAADEAFDWDVDESAHDNPNDENHRRGGTQMQFR